MPLDKIIITSSFGTRKDPFSGGQGHHSGIDLKAHYEEVLSMLDGYVIGVGQDSRSGLYVILEYGKYTISYCHLSRVLVNKGDMVLQVMPLLLVVTQEDQQVLTFILLVSVMVLR